MKLLKYLNLCNLLKICVIYVIRFYHNYISPYMLCKCRYYPSCSEYTIEAIEHRGVVVGLVKGLGRILRCNPLFPGGYDPYLEPVSKFVQIWKQVPRTRSH